MARDDDATGGGGNGRRIGGPGRSPRRVRAAPPIKRRAAPPDDVRAKPRFAEAAATPAATSTPSEPPQRLTRAQLVAFVMQTFGSSRWTQDSPIVPDVWLGYLADAETEAYERMKPGPVKLGERIDGRTRTRRRDLLITPWSGVGAGELAHRLRGSIDPCWIFDIERPIADRSEEPVVSAEIRKARIAAGASRVVAELDLETLLAVVLPETGWWIDLARRRRTTANPADGADAVASIDGTRPDEVLLSWLLTGATNDLEVPARLDTAEIEEVARFVCLVGLIRSFTACTTTADYRSLAADMTTLGRPIFDRPLGRGPVAEGETAEANGGQIGVAEAGVGMIEVRDECVEAFRRLHHGWSAIAPERRIWLDATARARMAEARRPNATGSRQSVADVEAEVRSLFARERDRKAVWIVNVNRVADRTLMVSRQTIKADAATRVFDVAGKGITFAVVDDGIDATHAAFNPPPRAPEAPGNAGPGEREGRSCKAIDRLQSTRVIATYDFTAIRDVLNGIDPDRDPRGKFRCALRTMPEQRLRDLTSRMRRHIADARQIDWDIIERMIRVAHDKDYFMPAGGHGTHVAGIMAADWEFPDDDSEPVLGVCPEMSLYDLRVFDANGRTDEFSILCALEFVHWINRYREAPVIHGVNLSLAMVHDVSNFACGQTPICDAANRLVGAGVVVVAAAGNFGYGGNAADPRLGDTYRPSSITDPGNAEMVITVGSTHRRDPHAYGVSYFSARGPTGDGRRKPDLLAPGEKITSTAPGDATRCLDGTSMAAPHVAGAAALLMSRHPELVGNPCRIKEILMRSATDLGREPYYQGAGVLDVLRAMQAV